MENKDDRYILTAMLLFGSRFTAHEVQQIDGPGNLARLSYNGYIDFDGGWFDGGWFITQKGFDFIKEAS